VKLDKQSVGSFLADVPAQVICSHCGQKITLPQEVRKKLQTCQDYDDLATLDFLSDGEIDGHF
jgi:hypothetical protein